MHGMRRDSLINEIIKGVEFSVLFTWLRLQELFFALNHKRLLRYARNDMGQILRQRTLCGDFAVIARSDSDEAIPCMEQRSLRNRSIVRDCFATLAMTTKLNGTLRQIASLRSQ